MFPTFTDCDGTGGGTDAILCDGELGNNSFIRSDLQGIAAQALTSGGNFCATNSGCTSIANLMAADLRDIRRFDLVYSGSGSLNDIAFCFNPETTPITLRSFQARPSGGGVRFNWTTETEFRNAGFYIEYWRDGGWRRVNKQLIPSTVVDSLAPVSYQYEAAVTGTYFRVVDVSTRLRERVHGPFELGKFYGTPAEVVELDLAPAKAERKGKRAKRRAKRLKRKVARLQHRHGRRGTRRNQGDGESGPIVLSSKVSEELTEGLVSAFPVYDFLVAETGIYRVNYADLLVAGVDLAGVPVTELALTNRGKKVPIRVIPESGSFGPGGYVEFIGEGLRTLYTPHQSLSVSCRCGACQTSKGE